jgi:hypothetical protein
MDSPRRSRWWITGVAALLAGIFLWESFGLWGAAAVVAAMAGFVMFESRRRERPAAARCLKCGEALNANARQCDSCGSASWTVN